ncbi:MAG TPA: hypothetical protein VD704_04365 [Gaiellaceae bacterium]|nr:hypothetical protein [Gaiellaceae bacterium]
MRLARSLVKVVVVLAVAAGALGGAAALGSSLFPRPPRDAAEFAALVEAASTRAVPAERPTRAERRYVLRLLALCQRTAEARAALERERAELTRPAYVRARRNVLAGFDEGFRALDAPERYRAGADRIASLDRALLALADRALEARRAGDRAGFDDRLQAQDLLQARFDETMRRLDAPACAWG